MTPLSKDKARRFALAGNATITLQSENTGNHFTYKIVRSKTNDTLYFIHLLSGSDNNNDYQYIGCYYEDDGYFHPAATWRNKNKVAWPKSLRAINFFLDRIDNVPNSLSVYHEGRCGCCGRKLTTPESIERGFGPECAKYEI